MTCWTTSVVSFKFFVSKPSICLFYSLPFWWFAVFWGLDCMVFTFLSNTFSPLSVTIKNPTDKVQDHRGSNPRLLGENCYFFHLRCAFTLPPKKFFFMKVVLHMPFPENPPRYLFFAIDDAATATSVCSFQLFVSEHSLIRLQPNVKPFFVNITLTQPEH